MLNARALLSLSALLALVNAGCGKKAEPATMPASTWVAVLETDQGAIEIELLPTAAPKTVENFRLLAQRGYYNGTVFHRVVKDFMIQGGDPKGDGSGGESAWGGTFEDEIDKTSPLYRTGYRRGSVAMANTGPNTNQSQFFIVQKDYPLHAGFTIFGRVTRGIEIVDAIANAPTERGRDGQMTKPVKPAVITQLTVPEVRRGAGVAE